MPSLGLGIHELFAEAAENLEASPRRPIHPSSKLVDARAKPWHDEAKEASAYFGVRRRPPRFSAEVADVGQLAGEGGGGGHRRAHQMGAAAAALAALEIAVRGRGAALLGLELVGVHRQAHRAAGLA